MTLPHLHRSSSTLARSALLAVVLAAFAGTAVSQDQRPDAGPARTAIVAGEDAAAADVRGATARADGPVEVRRTSGPLDAQAQATRLSAEGYDVIVGIGADARAAVSQAASAEVGTAATSWRAATHE
jgi:hypothetical protein